MTSKKLKLIIGLILLGIVIFLKFSSATLVNPDETYDKIVNWSKDIKYNPDTEQITVQKDNFFFKTDIAEYVLKENNCSENKINCWATGETYFEKQGTLFDELNFYKIMENATNKGKVRRYYVFINTTGKNETQMEWVCNENQTNCSYELTTYPLPEWSIYNGELFNPGENIEWRINAFKSPHHTIDWIAKVFGNLDLTPWALWYGDGGQAWQNVTLNSPENNYISLSPGVNFSCSASNNETSIENISLEFYENGSWINSTSLNLFSSSVYDEVNDNSINLDLWDKISSGSGYIHTNVYSENTDYMEAKVTIQDGSGSSKFSSKLLDYSSISEITIKTSLYGYSTYNDGGGFSIGAGLIVFGTTVKSVSRNSGSGGVSDTSVFNIIRNGNNFDIYDDGIYLTTITPTDNIISVYGSGSDNQNRQRYAYGRIYYLYVTEKLSSENVTFSQNLTGETLWRCSACDSDGDCGVSQENRTVKLDHPNISLISPSGTFFMKNFDILTNITAKGDLDYCSLNVTRGDGIEIANIEIPGCNESVNVNVSSYADYEVNIFANTTTGLSSTASFPFAVDFQKSIINVLTGGGGGGIIMEQVTQEKSQNTCQKLRDSVLNDWANYYEQGKTQGLLYRLSGSLVEYLFCKSASSIYPL